MVTNINYQNFSRKKLVSLVTKFKCKFMWIH